MTRKNILQWMVLFAAVLLTAVSIAQTPPKYTATEVQSLRLKVAQQNAQIAQRDVNDAQKRFQDSIALLRQEGEKVKTENKWPDSVTFDMNSLTFAEPPAPPKKEEPKK